MDRIDELRAQPSNVFIHTKSMVGTIEFNYKVKLATFWAKYGPYTYEK